MNRDPRSATARVHEPLIHITKRVSGPRYYPFLVRILAVLAALLVCAVLTTVLTGVNPLAVFSATFRASFGSGRKIWSTMHDVAILLSLSLALTPAFRMRFWNVGGDGQALVGCLASAACMITLRGLMPNWLVIVCMVVTSILAGALWGFIPAFFKAKWGTNETLFTLMMNYIATQLVAFFCVVWENPKGSGKIGVINQRGIFQEVGWLPVVGGQKYLLTILVALILCGLIYIYLTYSKHGFEISVVGESENTARYLGIKVDRVIIRTMVLSGAMCGLVGLLLTGSTNHTLSTTLVDNRGFTAVMVSWLAHFNPFYMILSSFLIVLLGRGGSQIASDFALNESFSDILTGIILFFIIGCEFFISSKVHFRRRAGKEDLQHV